MSDLIPETPDEPAKMPSVPFEQALAELEKIVDRMESGELSLDDSLAAFEQGVRLTRSCQQALAAAELRVEQLLRDDDTTPAPESGSVDD